MSSLFSCLQANGNVEDPVSRPLPLSDIYDSENNLRRILVVHEILCNGIPRQFYAFISAASSSPDYSADTS
jgi:hypothetical protein